MNVTCLKEKPFGTKGGNRELIIKLNEVDNHFEEDQIFVVISLVDERKEICGFYNAYWYYKNLVKSFGLGYDPDDIAFFYHPEDTNLVFDLNTLSWERL